MSTTIYHVYEHSPNYSDGYTHLEKSWSTKVKADEHRDQLEAEYLRLGQIQDGIRKVSAEINNAFPQPIAQSYKPRPAWPTGLGKHQITQAMRDERQAIEDYNSRIAEEDAAAYRAWRDGTLYPAIRDYLRSMGEPEDKVNKYDGTQYRSYTEKTFYVEAGYLD